jgi:ornithine cyclodeaminase/alanine dehydrogenase-like protein (mu-crystallin family)
VRILRDADVDRLLDRRHAVELLVEGFEADARGEVVPFPRSRTDATGTTLAWLGAALPRHDALGFRSYLYDAGGADRGEQIVALYRKSTMELRALLLGSRVGTLRTGAAVAAALRVALPDLRSLGILGTGTQAREAVANVAASFRLEEVLAWSPDPGHRHEFVRWVDTELHVPARAAPGADAVVRDSPAIVLATSADVPVVTPEMVREPRLLLSLSAYRRPEIDPRLLDAAPRVWTDSVVQAGGPGTLFEGPDRRAKLVPLADAASATALRDPRETRIVINTGAAWEEVLVAESLARAADREGVGVVLDVGPD